MVNPFMNPMMMAPQFHPMMNPMMGHMQMPMMGQMQMPMMQAGIPTMPIQQPQGQPQVHAMPQAQVQPQQQQGPGQKDLKWLKSSVREFNSKPISEQKMILGNLMYQKVAEHTKNINLIPKITGMLIDLEVLSIEEIIEILENRAILAERIDEAIKIIEEDSQAQA